MNSELAEFILEDDYVRLGAVSTVILLVIQTGFTAVTFSFRI
jgi:hypothetical protein